MYKKKVTKEDMVSTAVIAIPLWKSAEAVREKRARVLSVHTRNDAAGPYVDKETTDKRGTKIDDVIRAVSEFFGCQPAQFCMKKMAGLPIRDTMVLTNNGDKTVK
ncbi:unnamed protein product [Nippostrongylus brasiliensis]|uniref:DUF362 domain-containing protein n=1 Tax=Nippostrongylus brasiliensis TaxID=27835 RepID=A0A0N4YJZ8_NIPBR|nr:unnamed protein product [Nippostrongylus brasiliensis]